jgi:hypothetical protein
MWKGSLSDNWVDSNLGPLSSEGGALRERIAAAFATIALRYLVGAVLDAGFWRDLPFDTPPQNGRKVPGGEGLPAKRRGAIGSNFGVLGKGKCIFHVEPAARTP